MTALLCGCTDVVDNVVEPVIVDPVTEEVYENEDLMDRTVKPGDSFYEFALGSWLKNREEADEGLLVNLAASVSGMLIDAFNNSDDPIVQQLLTAADEVEDTETFVQQLQAILADGLSGEAFNHGLREYFLHYPLIYQSAPSPDDLEAQLTNDVHSANHNRVIGITRLMDEWYDLFNVADGQWYLPPAERVKIW